MGKVKQSIDSSSITPPINNPSSTVPTAADYVFHSIMTKMDSFNSRLESVEKSVKPISDYFKIAKIVSIIALIVFILLPIAQIGLTFLFIEKKLDDNFVKKMTSWVLSGLSILTIVEIATIPFLLLGLKERVEKLEKKEF